MNIYLFVALAFGTMTGDVRVPDAPVGVHIRAEHEVSVSGLRSPVFEGACSGDRRPKTRDRFRMLFPLTGALSPRAPAVTC